MKITRYITICISGFDGVLCLERQDVTQMDLEKAKDGNKPAKESGYAIAVGCIVYDVQHFVWGGYVFIWGENRNLCEYVEPSFKIHTAYRLVFARFLGFAPGANKGFSGTC